jgi:group I intron endonuclease
MGYIYCIVSPSGKRYIGQTKRCPYKRYKEHCKDADECSILKRAFKKYGEASMKMEILLLIDNGSLDTYEQMFIEWYNTCEPYGYNIRSGGSSGVFSNEAKERMRSSKLGDRNHNYGKPRSDAAKKAISLSKMGKKHHFYGKELTDSHKLNLSSSRKKYDTTLPMYIAYVKERPAQYQSAGYAVVNHPSLKNKYFTSGKITLEDKLKCAIDYLQTV